MENLITNLENTANSAEGVSPQIQNICYSLLGMLHAGDTQALNEVHVFVNKKSLECLENIQSIMK